jgi:L-ascorbate metabolism protein UlaG (beta-lactamase superfamily)
VSSPRLVEARRSSKRDFSLHGAKAMNIEITTPIVDPWLFGSAYWRSWWNYPPVDQERVRSLRADFVYLSHIHWDHFHGPSLHALGKDVRILIPEDRAKQASASESSGSPPSNRCNYWGFLC